MSKRNPTYFLVGGVSVSSILWTLAAFVVGGAFVIAGFVWLALKGMGI